MKAHYALLATVCLLAATPALANEGHADAKAEKYMQKIDTNGDSQISKEEHVAFGERMFTEADTSGDGMISLPELKAQKEKEMKDMDSEKANNNGKTDK